MNKYTSLSANNQHDVDSDEDKNSKALRSESTGKKYKRALEVYDKFVRDGNKRTKFSDLAPKDISGDNGNAIGIAYVAFLLNCKQPSGKLYAVNTVLEYYK